MSTLWFGDIGLPAGLASSILQGIEFSCEPATTTNTASKRPSIPEEAILNQTATLNVVCTIDPSQVPLWMTCGPSLKVNCENEVTANILGRLFELNASSAEAQQHISGLERGTQSKHALLVSVQDAEDKEGGPLRASMATELVMYGIWMAEEQAMEEHKPEAGGFEERVVSSTYLLVYALPLQAPRNNDARLVKVDPNIEQARFISSNHDDRGVTQSARKRKTDQTLDDLVQLKKNKRSGGLPPGLRPSLLESSMDRSRSLSKMPSLLSMNGNSDPYVPILNTGRRSRPQSATGSVDHHADNFERQMSLSLEDSKPTVPRRPFSREPSAMFERHRRERSITIMTNGDDGLQGSLFATGSTAILNTFTEKNKSILQRLVMNSLKMSGLQKGKKGSGEYDEYQAVYHQILKSTAFAVRKRWDVENVEPETMRGLVDTFTTLYLAGTGIGFGGEDEEVEFVHLVPT